MAKALSVKIDVLNIEHVKTTIGILKSMLRDNRIDLKLREEYAERYDGLIKQLEYDEYCKNAAESHSGLEW